MWGLGRAFYVREQKLSSDPPVIGGGLRSSDVATSGWSMDWIGGAPPPPDGDPSSRVLNGAGCDGPTTCAPHSTVTVGWAPRGGVGQRRRAREGRRLS